LSVFDEHFQRGPLAVHRHERRGGGKLSTRLIHLDSPAHDVVDPPTRELVLGLITGGRAGARWSWDGARPNVADVRRPGTLGLTPVGAGATFQVDGRSSILIVSLPFDALVERLAPDVAVPHDFGVLHDAYQDHPVARHVCRRLWRAAGIEAFGHDGLIDSLSESLLVTLTGPLTAAPDACAITGLERARILARADAPDADVAALAGAASMPVRTFRRHFRASFGLSPHRWLAHRRIAKAQRLLRDRRLSLAEIALELGFASQAHFTDAFRQDIGVTPGRWRREVLA